MTSILQLFRTRWRSMATLAVAAVVVSACGGGVDSGGTGGPAQSYAAGPISGFGSIIVNGVRYVDSAARVIDEDGVQRSRSELALGMTVGIEAGPIVHDESSDAATAVARQIRFGSAIRGPVQAIDVAASTVTVLGQRVKVDADTVFAGVEGLSGLGAGALLEVHALLDTGSGTYTATRIQLRTAFAEYRLRGVVSRLDLAAKTFSIGGARISFAGVLPQDLSQLAEGAVVRVKLLPVQQGDTWVLSKAAIGQPSIPEGTEAEVEGLVGEFSSLGAFKVDGVPVDASGPGVEFKHGTSAQVAEGVRIEVEGQVQNGVIVARKVNIKKTGASDDDGDDDDDGSANDEDDDDGKRFTLHGTIESLDASQASFVLRGTTVVHDSATKFVRGSAANLQAGAEVEVKGVLTQHGTQLRATRIRFGK
jgi:hypothetical protein